VWSDALFLSAYKHCAEQQNQNPMIFTNLYENGMVIGKRRPKSAIADVATATAVEVTVNTGDLVMDLVINDFLDAANREVLMNPNSKFSSSAVCSHDSGNLVVQNFANTATANAEGIKQLAALVKKADISDECSSTSDDLYNEKKIL